MKEKPLLDRWQSSDSFSWRVLVLATFWIPRPASGTSATNFHGGYRCRWTLASGRWFRLSCTHWCRMWKEGSLADLQQFFTGKLYVLVQPLKLPAEELLWSALSCTQDDGRREKTLRSRVWPPSRAVTCVACSCVGMETMTPAAPRNKKPIQRWTEGSSPSYWIPFQWKLMYLDIVDIVSVDFKCDVFSTVSPFLLHHSKSEAVVITVLPPLPIPPISVSNARKGLNGKNKHLKLILASQNSPVKSEFEAVWVLGGAEVK